MGSLWVQAVGALPVRATGTSLLACPLHLQYCMLAAPTLLVNFCTNMDLRAQSRTVPLFVWVSLLGVYTSVCPNLREPYCRALWKENHPHC